MSGLTFTLSDEQLGELVDLAGKKAAGLVLAELRRHGTGDPWLNSAEAAEYLRCSRQRLYDLHYAGKLKAAGKDGRRPLWRRSALDAYVEANAAAA